jgi:hypothetical protein
MFKGDDLRSPSRLGEYILEPDLLAFMTGRPGLPKRF